MATSDIFDTIAAETNKPPRDIFDEVADVKTSEPAFQFSPPQKLDTIDSPEIQPFGGRGTVSEPRVGEVTKSEPANFPTFWQAINTPIRKMVGVSDNVNELGSVTTLPFKLGSKIIGEDTGVGKVLAGTSKGLGSIQDSLVTPLGLATLGLSAAPVAVQRAVAGIFTAYMAANAPKQVAQIHDQFKAGDVEGGTASTIELLGGGLMAGMAAKHAFTGEPVPSTAIGEPVKPVGPKGAQAEQIASEILKARRDGATPEFKSLFGGIDPQVAGTTAEAVSAYAKSLGMEYKPLASEPIPEKPTTTGTENASAPIRNITPNAEVQLSRTAPQQDVRANTPQVGQVSGQPSNAGNRVIPTTPVESEKPGAPETQVIAKPLSLKSGDVAPVEPSESFLGQKMYRATAPFSVEGMQGPAQTVGSVMSQAVLDKYGLKVPEVELGKVSEPVKTDVVKTDVVMPKPTTSVLIQKYRIGTNPQTYEIVERLPQSASEKEIGEQPVSVKNDKTGKVETVLEVDLTPVNQRTAEEKGAKRDLDAELRAVKLDPSVFPDNASKRAALKRQKAISGRQSQLPNPAAGEGNMSGKGWLEPDGTYHQLTGDESHEGFARRTVGSRPEKRDWMTAEGFDASEELYKRGWKRIVPYGSDELMANTTRGRQLTPKQLSALKDYSVESGKKVVFDNGNSYNYVATPEEASLGKAEPVTLREGESTGVPAVRELVSESGLSARTIQVAQALLDLPMMQDPFWQNLRVELTRVIDGGAKGTRLGNLIQLAATATPDTLPHEIAHILFDSLTPEYRIAIEKARREALREHFPDAPPEVMAGNMGSDAYRQSSLPLEMYPYSNASEFMSTFFGEQFDKESWNERNYGFWKRFGAQIKRMAMAIWDALARITGRPLTKERAYREFRNGTWTPTPESGAKAEARQASLARSAKEAERKLFFKEPGTGEALAGAYGSVSKMTRAVADSVNANDRVRALLNLPKQEELAAIGQREVSLDNYYDVMQSVANAAPAVKTEVSLGAWHLLGFEQSRSLNLEALAYKQREAITSEKFIRKLNRLEIRTINKETLAQAKETFLNIIGQEAGTVVKQMVEKKGIDLQYEQLQEDLKRLRKMPEFSQDVANRVQDIVDTLSMVDGGLDFLYQSTGKSGDNIYRAYLDIKQSIGRIGEPRNTAEILSEWDKQFLSDKDKAKAAQSGMPVVSNDAKAFAKLASQVLAVNRDMSANLATLSFLKADPDLEIKVTEVGKQFARQVAKDPVKAIDTLVQKASRLGAKSANAETVWAALNKDVTREVQRYADSKQAVDILTALHASPEWQKLVNDIHANVEGSVRTPDVVRKQMKSSQEAFNEFTSNPMFVSPSGGVYKIDLGGTKAEAGQSWQSSRSYLNEIDEWLDDPKNDGSPDRQFWQDRKDFVEAVYMASTVTSPPSVLPMALKHSWYIPDYLFDQMSLPAARVARIAFDNLNASYAASSGWVYNNQEKITFTMALAAKSHGIPIQYGLKQYQEQVLNQMGYLARAGQQVKAGTVLDNGIVVNDHDVRALTVQGNAVNSLFKMVSNAGRERVMTDRKLLDEWAVGQFGMRFGKELGGETGTTLPHNFSERGTVLSRLVADMVAKGKTVDDIAAVLNQSNNFDYVRFFMAQRKASFVTQLSPFEEMYRQLSEKVKNQSPDAPQSIADIVDYIANNSEYPPEQVKAMFVGEMTSRLEKFYKQFIEPADPSDIRFSRLKTSSALTKGFVNDVENSFFYDYGMASDGDVRALATDAQNYHVVRIDIALDSLRDELIKRLDALRNVPEKGQKAFKKAARKEFRSGESFLDFDRLENQLTELEMFRNAMPSWTGRRTIDAALVSKGTRIVGDVVSSRLTGWGTTSRILVGSIYKMGTVYAALDHGMLFAWPKAMASMAMSVFKVGVPSVAGGAYKLVTNTPEALLAGAKAKGRLNVKMAVAVQKMFEGMTEETMRPSKYLEQQHRNGLVPDQLLGYRLATMLLMPQSKGRGYDPRSRRFLWDTPHNIGNLFLTAAELPIELLRSYLPQLAYNIAYDSAARQAGWTIDVLEAAARRAFDVHEKMGTLGKFDLNNPSNPKNVLLASEVMPMGLVPKTQTSLNQARNWFRSIDVPYNETVLNFWKRLSETPKAERGKIRMLSADIADPVKAADMAERRGVALMADALRSVHHAAPTNRPWIMRSVPFLRIINPFIGWSAQTSRQWFALLGKAQFDPQHGRLFLWATTIASVLGMLAFAAFNGDLDKRLIAKVKKFMLNEEDVAKHFGQGETAVENLKILASDATAHIAMLNTMVNSVLGMEGSRGGMNFTPMLVDEVNGWLQLARGMISSHDFTYGLERWAGREVPFYRTLTNRLPQQQGLTEQRAVRTLLDKYGPDDMKRAMGAITEAPLPTQLSPYKEALANAIFRGDAQDTAKAYQDFVDKAREMGKPNPEQYAQSTVRGLNPYQQVFGQKLTDEQRQHLISQMTPGELERFTNSENNYQQAAASFGIGAEITKQPAGSGGYAGATSRRTGNRLRVGRSTRSSYRTPRMRAPRLRVSRSRFRASRTNRLRSRATRIRK